MNCQTVLSCHQLPLSCFITYLISLFFLSELLSLPFRVRISKLPAFSIYECDFNHNAFYMNDKCFCREGELVLNPWFIQHSVLNESLPVFLQLIYLPQTPLLRGRPQVPFLVLFSDIAGYGCLAVLAQICRGMLGEAEQPGWSSVCWWDRQMFRNTFPWSPERVKGLSQPYPGPSAWGSPPVHLHLSLRGPQVSMQQTFQFQPLAFLYASVALPFWV